MRSQNFEKRLLASSCLSIRMEKHGFHWTDFHEILMLENFFRKSVEEIQVSLKYTKIIGTLHEDLLSFKIISRCILRVVRNISDKSC